MGGEEEEPDYRGGQSQVSGGRKSLWKSASWSSRSVTQNSSHSHLEQIKDFSDHNGSSDKSAQFRRFPVPLTPRSQQNCKARACLPPLQPLSIARRSVDEWPKAGSDDVEEWPQPATPSGRGDSSRPGEGLKLDLSSFQRNPDPTGSLVKREKIAFFDKECSKVAEHIYLGSDAVAKNRDILRQHGITHVLNCVGFVCPEYFKSDLVYKTLWLQDSPSEDITSILYDVFDYFEDVREQGGRVLVHCCQGVSRSTSLVIAYLMWREGQSFDDAFQYVKAARGIANPNMGFACQLLQCQKRVHAIPLSPSSVLRMYRMAPHSPYDPLHLVPKMLNDPSPSALDSRGAFIVHVSSVIYIWIGKNCEPIMERDAKGAASQVVRYERVQGPVVSVEEGEEPPDFWDAFSSTPHPSADDKSCNGVQDGEKGVREGVKEAESAVKICPGDRKVDSYDVDFELFKKAITGGVVPPGAGHETHLPTRESNWSVLRRKFAAGNVKEVVSAPKVALCRVYSDSMLIVDLDHSRNKASPLSADSSSSPPYLSPSSLSSDSSINLKCSSESPSISPSTPSCCTPSPVSSSFSDSSFLSAKSSLHPNSCSPKAPDINPTSQMCPQSVSSLPKQVTRSLAQRRGSLSPSLKLPTLIDDKRGARILYKRVPSACIVTHQGGDERYENTSSLDEPSNIAQSSDSQGATTVEVGNLTYERQLRVHFGGAVGDNSFHEKGLLVKTDSEHQRNSPFEKGQNMSVFVGLEDNRSAFCNPEQLLVYCLPNLKRVENFGVGDLNSETAFLLLTPSTGIGKHDDKMLYVWVGKSFKHKNHQTLLASIRDGAEREAIDWNQVGVDFLSRMGLPNDILIKVVNEDNEPTEFHDLMNYSLHH